MNDLTELQIFITGLIRPIIKEAIKENLEAAAKDTKYFSPSVDVNDLLTVEGAAKYLHYSVKTIYGKVHTRSIPFIKNIGSNKLFFSRSELQNWLQNGKKK